MYAVVPIILVVALGYLDYRSSLDIFKTELLKYSNLPEFYDNRPRCRKYGRSKVKYGSQEEAEVAVRCMRNRYPSDTFEVFKCRRGCEQWHIGRSKKVALYELPEGALYYDE